jgi:hypothetical protein
VEAEGERLDDEYRAGINLHWHGAAFGRSKRLPNLKKFLQKEGRAKRPAGVDEGAVKASFMTHNEIIRQRAAAAYRGDSQ